MRGINTMGKIIKLKPGLDPRKVFSSKKRVMIFIIALILVISGLFCYWYFIINKPSGVDILNNGSSTADEVAALDKSQNRYIQAVRAVSVDGYDAGQSFLDDEIISNTNNDVERSYLYIQKSDLAINNANMDEAIAFAEKAEGFYQSRISAVTLAQLYEKKGDKANAIKFYKLTIERTTEDAKQMLPYEINDYQLKINELSR